MLYSAIYPSVNFEDDQVAYTKPKYENDLQKPLVTEVG